MELDSYNVKYEVGTEEIWEETLYKYSDPYGIYNGKVFYFYCPGRTTSDLSDGFKGWANGAIGGLGSTFEGYSLHNYDEDQGFFN